MQGESREVMRPLHRPPEWSNDLAYVVGLITTDGCLYSDGRHIEFTSKDFEQVQLLKELLGLKNRIAQKSSGYWTANLYWRIQFGDVALYRWLVDIGLSPHKSKSLGPLSIPDEYFFGFLRGHLDGDGTIRNFADPVYRNAQRLYVVFYSASRAHLEWLQQTTERLAEIHGFIENGKRAHRLTYAKTESLTLLRRIYPNIDVPCLKRKRDLAEPFL